MGPGHAGLRAGDFILWTVGFVTIDGVFSKGETWFAFSTSDLSAFSCILLWDGLESGLDLKIPMEHIKAQRRVLFVACGQGASFGRF